MLRIRSDPKYQYHTAYYTQKTSKNTQASFYTEVYRVASDESVMGPMIRHCMYLRAAVAGIGG